MPNVLKDLYDTTPVPSITNSLVDLGIVADPRGDEADEHEHVHHEGTNRLRLADVQSWKPPRKGKVDLQAIENAVFAAHKRFGLSSVHLACTKHNTQLNVYNAVA